MLNISFNVKFSRILTLYYFKQEIIYVILYRRIIPFDLGFGLTSTDY